MASKEARLILRLVDGVSGPAKGIVGSLGKVSVAANTLTKVAAMPGRVIRNTGRQFRRATQNMAAFSGPVLLGAGAAMEQVYEMQKQLNAAVAAGNLDMAQRTQLMRRATDLNAQYAATSSEIVGGVNELLKAGIDFDTAMGAIVGVLDTAQAMGVPIDEASSAVVNAMVSMRLPMATTEEAMRSSARQADLFAYAVNETTASLAEFATSGKYFNPVAAAIGMTAEQAMALQIALAKAGIMGSSAGTGLRNLPTSIATPTKRGRAAFASLGIDYTKYLKKGRAGAASGSSLVAVLESAGYGGEGMEDAIDQILKNPAFKGSSAKLANAIVAQLGEQLGVATAQDRSKISNILQDNINKGVEQIDVFQALRDLHAKGAGIKEYTDIFGKQHASKMMAIPIELLDEVLKNVQEHAAGTAKTMREAMVAGIVGDWNALTAAVEKFSNALGNSGLLADFAAGIERVARAMDKLSNTNPTLLRWGAYAALAVAGLAPLGLAIEGLAAALGLVLSPIGLFAAALADLAYVNWDAITRSFTDFGVSLKANIRPDVLAAIANGFNRVKSAFDGLTVSGSQGSDWGAALGQGINRTYDLLREMPDRLNEFYGRIQASPTGAAAVQSVTDMFDMLGRSGGAAQSALQGLATAGSSFISGFIDAWSPGSTAKITIGMQNLFTSMSEWYGNAGRAIDLLKGKLDLINWAGYGAKAGNWAGDAASKIISAFSGIDLYAIGQNIINSLLNGLASAWGSVLAKISEWKAAIQNAFSGITASVGIKVNGPASNAPAAAAPAASAGTGPFGMPMPGKAAGGAVRRGLTYEINERGREMVTMGTNGYVTPAGRGGGVGGPLVGEIHIHGASADQVMAKLDQTLRRTLQRTRQLSLDGRPVTT